VNKFDVSDCGFAHLTLILLLRNLVKCRSRSLAVYTTISSYWVVHALAQLLFQDGVYCRRQKVDQQFKAVKRLHFSSRRFLKEFLRKIRHAEDLTTCFQTLTNMDGTAERVPSIGQPTAHCMYVWQHDLKVDTISVKQVTIFNDFVDSQWFSEPTRATQYEFIVVNGQTTTSGFHKVV